MAEQNDQDLQVVHTSMISLGHTNYEIRENTVYLGEKQIGGVPYVASRRLSQLAEIIQVITGLESTQQ